MILIRPHLNKQPLRLSSAAVFQQFSKRNCGFVTTMSNSLTPPSIQILSFAEISAEVLKGASVSLRVSEQLLFSRHDNQNLHLCFAVKFFKTGAIFTSHHIRQVCAEGFLTLFGKSFTRSSSPRQS